MSTHAPIVHSWPVGHVAPAHLSVQVPAAQSSVEPQVLPTQPESRQWPLPSQVLPAAQPAHLHAGTQTPPSHTRSASHVTSPHGSTQRPTRHTCPPGHFTPSHGPAHTPPLQVLPASHVTFSQAFSTHSFASLHVSPGAHGNSVLLHGGTQVPRSQTWLLGQGALSSTMPLQSLSRPSQTSALAVTEGLHLSVVP